MKREQKGGVKQGFYLNRATGEFIHLDRIDTMLSPKVEGQFVKVPAAAVIFGAPLISLAYVIFLPLAGLAGLAVFLGLKLRNVALAKGHKAEAHNGGIT